MSEMISSPPSCLSEPIKVTPTLLMGPGPSNPYPEVLASQGLPVIGHHSAECEKIMDDIKAGIRYLFQTENEWTFAVSGTGNAAMETAVVNLLEVGDVLLSCRKGQWGERIRDMAERNGSIVKKIVKPMGEVFSLEDIEQGLKEHKPKVVFIAYGESSAGTAQPLEGIGDLCHKYGALFLVDAVAIAGAAPLFMDAWNIDVMFAAAQKPLGVPPGVSPISFNQRARDVIMSRKTLARSYYFDAIGLAGCWDCAGVPRRAHHTCMVSNLYGLREGLACLAEMGLAKSWEQHAACAQMLWDGLDQLGLELLVKDKNVRNPCITVILVPEGVELKKVTNYMIQHHKIEISGGLGDLVDTTWRIGIMGYNCTPEKVKRTLDVFQEALEKFWNKN